MKLAWRGKMKLDPKSKLWVRAESDRMAEELLVTKSRPGLLQRVGGRKKTIYNGAGRPIAEVQVSEAGNSHHVYDDHQDAVARPEQVKLSAQVDPRAVVPYIEKDYPGLPTYLQEALRALDKARYTAVTNPHDVQCQQAFRGHKRAAALAQQRYAAEQQMR